MFPEAVSRPKRHSPVLARIKKVPAPGPKKPSYTPMTRELTREMALSRLGDSSSEWSSVPKSRFLIRKTARIGTKISIR